MQTTEWNGGEQRGRGQGRGDLRQGGQRHGDMETGLWVEHRGVRLQCTPELCMMAFADATSIF